MHLPSLLRTPGRLAGRLAILLAPLLLSGCDLNFWTMKGHQTTMVPEGPVAKLQLDIFMVTVWVTLVIFILVGSALAYATFKFRARNEEEEHAEPPPQGHGNPLVELSLIGASVLALVIIAIPTLKGIWYDYDVPTADAANVYEIKATGYQWWFKFDYTGEGSLNTANELVIPAGRPIRIQLRTNDVIHSFWVPKLGGKVDMMPNRGNFLWLQADKPGYFWAQCAEYCGDSHAVMRFRVIALAQPEFDAWLAAQKAPARTVAGTARQNTAARTAFMQQNALATNVQEVTYKRNQFGFSDKWTEDMADPLAAWKAQQAVPTAGEDARLVQQGRNLFTIKTCAGCHTVTGHDGAGLNGPNLTHVGSRTTIAAGLLENTPEQLIRWISHPNEVKPGNKMYVNGYVANKVTISPAEAQALAAYLTSLK